MESLSRSSQRRKHSTTAANVFSSSFSFKNPYGDVLLSNGGQRKSPQVHEYSEIFSGSSSIPVLDLSGLDERAGSGDSQSSKLDYTNIFGGLTHDDVFLPHEELLKGSAKKAKTRIPAEGQSYLQESVSEHFSRKMERPHGVESVHSVGVKLQESGSLPSTKKTVRPTGVASDQSVLGVKLQEPDSPHPSRKMEKPSVVASDQSVDGVDQQLSMPFNSINHRYSDATDVKAPSGKLHAVPGFTHFVDGNRPHKVINDRPPLPKREVSRTWSFSAELEPASSKGGSSFENSQAHDKPHSANKVNIKSQLSHEQTPSSYPSNPSDIMEPRQLRAMDFVARGDVPQKVTGESTEEFDDNSVDAASAATLKKAIEQAQESIRIAKLIMERKKDGFQDGSKSRPLISLKVADGETKMEASGSKDNISRKIYDELDPVFPKHAGIDGKSTPSPSHSGACIDAWENVETDRGHEETIAGSSCKLFASNHIQSEATYVADNVSVEKLENVEAAQEQSEAKNFPGCRAIDLEPAEVGNIDSLTPSTSELTSNIGWSGMGKESFERRNVAANHTKGSGVVSELMEGAISTSQQTQGMERNLVDELCHARFSQAEGPDDNEGIVLNSSHRFCENRKVVDEASASLRVGQDDGVNEQRENDRNGKEQQGKKLEECDNMFNVRSEFNDMLNASHNLVGEQEEMEKKTESVKGDDWSDAQAYDEEIRGARQTECENKELLKELLLEVFNKGKFDVLPVVGEFKNRVDVANEPQIKDNKQKGADDGDEPKSPEELVHNQVEEEHVKTSNYEAARTIMMEANQGANVQESRTISEAEKMVNTLRDESIGEDYHKQCQFEEAAYGEDIDEAVNLSCSEASRNLDAAHTNETSNITAEAQEPCDVESNCKSEDQKPAKNSEENVSNGAVSAGDKDKMAEQSFNLQDDEMLRTNYLHRSASEEIFVENKLHYAFEGLPSDSRTEDVVLDTDPEENLSEDGNVSKTTNDTHAAPQEHATEFNLNDIPEVHGSNIRTEELDPADVEQVLEQTTESDEGSLSVSSFEKIDDFSAQESEECARNLKDTTSNKEDVRDEFISDGRKCAEEGSQGLCSQLHDEPKEMVRPLETEEALDADVDVEKDKENLAGMPPMEEGDVKEGGQNFESDDQQQRIEAIKRGREREKDRIAVERAIREARERAFAEVREKAERAAVERAATEVRQRIMGDGREKASAVKQPVDKSSTEAKLRAERAAVERATAEARERALEKARSQKISEEWRTPADRHSSSSSRNNALKHSFSSSDLETGTSTESAQRRKARLERHQRIMERAAKALEEKNMRDLLAQKEQAERNRFAESLDADIKRWASGKEGNLRALLSTLQYILGPESGWQPISLTEIITTAAVKKAYRKATLCVHPDKLQQRGASVQQKYVCEKVFDLLKAAWNRFNSDER